MEIPRRCPCCGKELTIQERYMLIGADFTYSKYNPNGIEMNIPRRK